MLVKLIMLYKEWIIYFIYVFLFSYSNSKKLNFYFWTTLCGMCFLWRLTADETRYDYRVYHKVHVYCIKCFIYGDLRSLKFIIIVLFYETPFKSTWSSNLLTINNFIKFRIDAKTSIQSVNQFYKSELFNVCRMILRIKIILFSFVISNSYFNNGGYYRSRISKERRKYAAS